MPNAHSARRALRTGATLSMVGILAVTTALSASADPNPVYPSKAQVDKAHAAVATTSSKVSSLDAQYAAASAQLSQVQDQAAQAPEQAAERSERAGPARQPARDVANGEALRRLGR